MRSLLLAIGLWRSFTGDLHAIPENAERVEQIKEQAQFASAVGFFYLMRGFPGGWLRPALS